MRLSIPNNVACYNKNNHPTEKNDEKEKKEEASTPPYIIRAEHPGVKQVDPFECSMKLIFGENGVTWVKASGS